MAFSSEGKTEGIGIGKKTSVSRVCDFWGGGWGRWGGIGKGLGGIGERPGCREEGCPLDKALSV